MDLKYACHLKASEQEERKRLKRHLVQYGKCLQQCDESNEKLEDAERIHQQALHKAQHKLVVP